jgi:hypothetical protein
MVDREVGDDVAPVERRGREAVEDHDRRCIAGTTIDGEQDVTVEVHRVASSPPLFDDRRQGHPGSLADSVEVAAGVHAGAGEGEVFEVLGDDVDDPLGALQAAADQHRRGLLGDAAEA